MKKLIETILLIFFLFNIGQAQINSEFEAYLNDGLEYILEEGNAIGVSIAVRSGSDSWKGTAGISAVDDSLTTNSILALGSISKTLVSACILQMMEDELLELSDPVSTFLENYEFIDSTITIKELLNHTSGVYNYTNYPGFFDTIFSSIGQSHEYTEQEILDQFVVEPHFIRGEKQEYSNTNYLLLGMIITEIAGQHFYDEIIQRFDMSSNYPTMSMPPFLSNTSELANLWFDLGNGFEDVELAGLDITGLFSSAGAAGAFVSTAEDLVNWGYHLYTGDLLTSSSMDSLFDYHPFGLFGELDYGLGVYLTETSCGKTAVGHGGSIFYTADLQYVEDYDLAIAVMTNDGKGIVELDGVAGIMAEIICNYEDYLSSTAEGFNEVEKIKIFPNPIVDQATLAINLTRPKSLTIEIYNQLGKRLWQKELERQQFIHENLENLSDLLPGIYMIKVRDGDKSFTEKIIKL